MEHHLAFTRQGIPLCSQIFLSDLGFGTETLMQSGWTALMYAASNGAVSIVKILLEHNADPNFQIGKYCSCSICVIDFSEKNPV